jgi:hypothetical protein
MERHGRNLYNELAAARRLRTVTAAQKEFKMKRIIWFLTIVCVASALGFGAGMSAAGKSYQFTGTVKSSDGGMLTVEKSAKEVWTFSTDKDTKGTAKVGDKVTVYYTMVATQIEAKAAAPAAAKKPAK